MRDAQKWALPEGPRLSKPVLSSSEVFDLKPTSVSPEASMIFLASLRLCERFFFQSVDDSRDAVLDQGCVTVDQQPKALVGEPQVGQELLFVHRGHNLDRLDLHDHLILDDQVGPEPGVDPDGSLNHGDRRLAHGAESTLRSFVRQHSLRNRFQPSWPQGRMDGEGGIHDFLGNGILGQGGCL